MSKKAGQELMGLIKLISFFKQVRHKKNIEELGFFLVNDLFNLIKYRQCVFWTYANGRVHLVSGSGQVDVNHNGPLGQFIKKVVAKVVGEKAITDAASVQQYVDDQGYAQIEISSFADYKMFSADEIRDFISPHAVNVLLYDDRGVIGGLWIARDAPLSEMEEAVLEDVSDSVAARLQFLSGKKFGGRRAGLLSGKTKIIVLIALGVFLLWPVRFSVSVSAEIVAKNNTVITVPYSGLIKEINVEPNQAVSEGDLLFSLDKTQLENDYNVAVQQMETATQKLSNTQRQVFSDRSKTADLNVLKEEIKLKKLEVDYARQRLDLADIKADRDGVILFSDKNELLGKPVQAGSKIMILADPQDMELLVKIPSENMIKLDYDVPVRFFLNTAPLTPHKAKIYNVSYQPSRDPDSLLTYKARAEIADKEKIEKLGLTGTAKLYGARTLMIFNVLRRPYLALRNLYDF